MVEQVFKIIMKLVPISGMVLVVAETAMVEEERVKGVEARGEVVTAWAAVAMASGVVG